MVIWRKLFIACAPTQKQSKRQPNYIRCACFAPLSRRRKSGANHIPCAVTASLLRFPVISLKKFCKKTVGAKKAHPRTHPLPCAAALRRPLRRPLRSPPPFPPPVATHCSLLSRDVYSLIFLGLYSTSSSGPLRWARETSNPFNSNPNFIASPYLNFPVLFMSNPLNSNSIILASPHKV